MSDQNVEVGITAAIGQFISSMEHVAESLTGIATPLSKIQGIAKEAGEALAAAFAIEKIAEFEEHMEHLAVATQRTMALLGATAGQVATINVAAEAAGMSLETVVHSMERLGLALARADAGSLQAKAALEALGISAKSFADLDTAGKMALLADKFSVVKDGIEKDAIAMALLGRGGAAMIPVFNQGAHAMEEFAKIVERAGSTATPQFLETMHGLHMQTIESSESWKGFGIAIMEVAGPAFAGLKQILIDLVETMTKSIREGGAMKVLFVSLAGAVSVFNTALAIAIGTIGTLWEVVKTAVFAIAEAFISLGRVIKDVFTFNFADIPAAFGDLVTKIQERAKVMAPTMEAIVKNMMGEIKKSWSEAADAEHKIEQDKNAKLKITNRDAVAAALEAAQQRIKTAEMEYQMTADRIKNVYGNFIFTEGAKTAALLTALDRRRALTQAALDDELKIGGLSLAQHQKILNEKLTADQKYAFDRQKIIEAAAKEEEKTWNTGFNVIQTSFNSQLRGLLAGTTTWTQAMKSMLGDMVIKAIELFEKMAFEWIAHEIVQTAATEAGVAARVGAEQTGALMSMATTVAKVIRSILNSAAETFAGVFGFLAPVMGPAAAAPAAASMGTVLGMAASVSAFDVGTDTVLRTGLALIHKGETIVPAQGSGPYTGAGQGGASAAPIVHVNLQAMDGASMASWLRSGGGLAIAKHVARAFDSNPSIRPRL